jgi:hypothetical protein
LPASTMIASILVPPRSIPPRGAPFSLMCVGGYPGQAQD